MKFTITLFLTLFISLQAVAQGTLKGKITDEKTGESLVGVAITIPELKTVGAYSDEDGDFELNAPDGTYTVEVKYMGYITKLIESVKLEKGTITPMNMAIQEEKKTTILKDVVVRSTLKKESMNALYIAQRNSASVSDGISAEAIKKSPDKSTGEVLKRVSGTTIQDNKFVIIRGLTDRYNTALIDNAFLPSTEPNRKAFSFDIIPSNLIDNIIISKSGTPDLPGDFAGGVINILTKEIPDKNFNSISIGTNYNTVSTFKKFETGFKSSTDMLGFDNGSRKLPTGLPSFQKLISTSPTQQESIKYLSMFNYNYNITDRKALPAATLQASMGRLYELKNNKRIGVTAAINYNHSENVKRDVDRIYGNYNFKDQIYNYSTTVGALANVAYATPSSKISFKNLYNRNFDDNFLYREGYDAGSTAQLKYYAFDLTQKALLKTSLEGDHQIGGDAQKKLNWVVSYNNVTNSQPDQRKVQYNQDPSTGDYNIQLSTLSKSNNRMFSKLNESIVNAGVNYTTPYKLNFLYKSSLKVGALALYRKRDFSNRYIGATTTSQFPESKSINDVFSKDNINSGVFNFTDQTSFQDMYNANTQTYAGYVMSDNRINTRLRAVWGLRMESYNLNLNTADIIGNPLVIQPTWNDLLPSLNMSYAVTEKSNIRMSYFKSVARPELREIAPIAYYDYELNMTVKGNEKLTRSRIDNIDLRFETFPRAGEVISASVFYKNFDKTIENLFVATGSPEINTVNYNSAFARGVEFEIRKKLDFIADNNVMKNFSFYANLALIQSEVKLQGAERNYLINSSRDTRQLSGQSPYVINTSLSYSALDGKLNFNVLYNRIGKRIFLVGGNGQFGDVYENPRNIIDFQTSLAVGKRSEFRLNIKDMLNAQTLYYYDQNNNKKWDNTQFGKVIDPNADFVLQRFRQGTNFSLTYTYRF